jgi:hypothetical protein
MVIDKQSLSVPRSIENISVIHENKNFTIEDDNGSHTLQPYQMSPALRNIQTTALAKMLAAGSYIKVNKALNDDSYSLDIDQRINAGGPVSASIGYWLVKAIGYGAPAGMSLWLGKEVVKGVLPNDKGTATTLNNAAPGLFFTPAITDIYTDTVTPSSVVYGFLDPNTGVPAPTFFREAGKVLTPGLADAAAGAAVDATKIVVRGATSDAAKKLILTPEAKAFLQRFADNAAVTISIHSPNPAYAKMSLQGGIGAGHGIAEVMGKEKTQNTLVGIAIAGAAEYSAAVEGTANATFVTLLNIPWLP